MVSLVNILRYSVNSVGIKALPTVGLQVMHGHGFSVATFLQRSNHNSVRSQRNSVIGITRRLNEGIKDIWSRYYLLLQDAQRHCAGLPERCRWLCVASSEEIATMLWICATESVACRYIVKAN